MQERIRDVSVSTRENVFKEVAADSPIPEGHAGITIVASLKTHRPGRHLLEKSGHGTPDYQLLLNIDGQAIKIQGDLREEDTSDGALRDPETGRGIRYTFRKDLLLKSGLHKVALALPADAVIAEYEMTLQDNSHNVLEIEPMYRGIPGKQRPGFYGMSSFLEGIVGLRGKLDGHPLKGK